MVVAIFGKTTQPVHPRSSCPPTSGHRVRRTPYHVLASPGSLIKTRLDRSILPPVKGTLCSPVDLPLGLARPGRSLASPRAASAPLAPAGVLRSTARRTSSGRSGAESGAEGTPIENVLVYRHLDLRFRSITPYRPTQCTLADCSHCCVVLCEIRVLRENFICQARRMG